MLRESISQQGPEIRDINKVDTQQILADIKNLTDRLTPVQKKALLMISAIALAGITIFNNYDQLYSYASETWNKNNATASWTYEGEDNHLDGPSQEIIERLKLKYSINIVSPVKDESGTTKNLPWTGPELSIVEKTLDILPEEIIRSSQAPKTIFLYKAPGTDSPGAGGSYAARALFLYTSETYDPASAFEEKDAQKLYGNQGNHYLRMVIIHEFIHSYTDADPSLLTQWKEQFGWQQDPATKQWTNQYPETIPPGMDNPAEDIAESAGFAATNPNALSEERLNFKLVV